MRLNISSAKWRPFCSGGDELNNAYMRRRRIWVISRNTLLQWRPFIARFIIVNILWSSILISLHIMLPFELTKDTPYLALSGELWSVFYEYFNKNWSCYKGFLLYIHTASWCCWLIVLTVSGITSIHTSYIIWYLPIYHILYCNLYKWDTYT